MKTLESLVKTHTNSLMRSLGIWKKNLKQKKKKNNTCNGNIFQNIEKKKEKKYQFKCILMVLKFKFFFVFKTKIHLLIDTEQQIAFCDFLFMSLVENR